MATLRLDDDTIAVVDGTCPAHYGYDARVEILCEKGVLFVGSARKHGCEWITVESGLHGEAVASFYDQTVAEVYDLYQKRLFASNAVDFDDMLFLTVDVLERFPEARKKWQDAFRYILVDEYQDTNHAQYRFLQLLADKHSNVFAVGDPAQCLVAGTMVTMADGEKRPIEFVQDGEEVLTCSGSGRFRQPNRWAGCE